MCPRRTVAGSTADRLCVSVVISIVIFVGGHRPLIKMTIMIATRIEDNGTAALGRDTPTSTRTDSQEPDEVPHQQSEIVTYAHRNRVEGLSRILLVLGRVSAPVHVGFGHDASL